jgi:hypothetical protein
MGLELRTGNNRRVHRRKAGAKTEGKMIEIQTQVQTATKPLKDIGLAIVQASKNCSDAAKPLIRAPTEEDRVQREIYIFYEFIYFFMYVTMRQAFAVLSASLAEKLQAFLVSLISSVAVDSYFAHWPAERKQGMNDNFRKYLSEQGADYSKCAESAITGTKYGLVPTSNNPVEHALVTELGVNVAQWSSKLEKVPKGVTLEGSLALDEWLAGLPPNVSKTVTTVGQVALNEWGKMQLETLVANAAKGNWENIVFDEAGNLVRQF